MRVVVTGSAGYIGSHLTPVLIDAGHEVIDIDLVLGPAHDIRRDTFVLPPCDVVVHLAGLIDARASMIEPFPYYAANLTGTLNLLAAMAAVDCHHLVFASSAIAATPGTSPYAASKRVIESIMLTLWDACAISYIGMRFHNVAGGRECHVPETHLIPRAIAAARMGTPLAIHGDGSAVRDYIHVLDVVDAIARSLEVVRTYPLNGIMDIGTGTSTTTLDVVRAVEEVVGRPIALIHTDTPVLPHTQLANPAHARTMLEWKSSRSLRDTIASACAALDTGTKVLQFRPGAPIAP